MDDDSNHKQQYNVSPSDTPTIGQRIIGYVVSAILAYRGLKAYTLDLFRRIRNSMRKKGEPIYFEKPTDKVNDLNDLLAEKNEAIVRSNTKEPRKTKGLTGITPENMNRITDSVMVSDDITQAVKNNKIIEQSEANPHVAAEKSPKDTSTPLTEKQIEENSRTQEKTNPQAHTEINAKKLGRMIISKVKQSFKVKKKPNTHSATVATEQSSKDISTLGEVRPIKDYPQLDELEKGMGLFDNNAGSLITHAPAQSNGRANSQSTPSSKDSNIQNKKDLW